MSATAPDHPRGRNPGGDRQGALHHHAAVHPQHHPSTERLHITLPQGARGVLGDRDSEDPVQRDDSRELPQHTLRWKGARCRASRCAHVLREERKGPDDTLKGAHPASCSRPADSTPTPIGGGAIARREVVRTRMLRNRYITQAEHDAAVASPLSSNARPSRSTASTPRPTTSRTSRGSRSSSLAASSSTAD